MPVSIGGVERTVGKICGTVNAKNGLDAYAGKQFFYAGCVHQGDAYQIFNNFVLRAAARLRKPNRLSYKLLSS